MLACKLFILQTLLRLRLAIWLPLFLCCVCIAARVSAQLPVVQLAALSQSGGTIGETFELNVAAGNRLDEIDELYFSHPGIRATLLMGDPPPFHDQPQPRYGQFRVAIADDVPAGRYEVRASGRHGLSNPRIFWVDRSSHLPQANTSHDVSTPAPLPHATWLHGRATAAELDYFALHLDAGQRVRVDLLCQKVDSRMIGALILMDADGRRLQSARGAEHFDPHILIEADKPTEYVLAVYDFLYRGGDDYFYQLAAHVDDLESRSAVAEPAEAAAVQGQVARWPKPQALSIVAFEDVAQWINATARRDVAATDVGQQVQPPCRLSGHLDPADESAEFEFAAKEGDRLSIELISERVGEPTDLRLIVERSEAQPAGDPIWHSLVMEDDGQQIGNPAVQLRTSDPIAQMTAPTTGTYRLRAQDLDSGVALGHQQSYWLEVRAPRPDYALLCYRPTPIPDAAQSQPQGSHLMRGSTEAIRVLALRRDGWAGPVDVSVDRLPPGVRCEPVTLAANQQEAQLTLTASEDAAGWTGPIRIVGRAMVDGNERVRDAVPATILWGPGGTRELVASRLSTEIMLSVSQHDVVPLSIEFGSADAQVLEVKKGGTLSVPIRLVRREGGKANCVLRPRDLPPGVTAAEVTIAGDATEGTLELKIAGDAAAGTYSLWLQAETQLTMSTNPQAVARAEQERARLGKLLEDPQRAAEREQIAAAVAAADAQVEAAKAAAQPTQLNAFLPSPMLTLRILDES